MKNFYYTLIALLVGFQSIAQCTTPPTAVCQDVTVYLDASGNATITAADLDGGSTDNCASTGLTFSASQTTFTCADLPTITPPENALVITGVMDGPLPGGTPKVIELHALADIADLSLYGLGSANNGGGSDGVEFIFPADAVTAGEFIYISGNSADFNTFFGFNPDYVDGASTSVNGDDAVELFYNSNSIDVFGDINVDGSGEPWEYTDGWAYRVNATGPDGATFVLTNWTFSGVDALDGEATNGSAATPFPVGTYTPAPVTTGVDVILTVTDGEMNSATCTATVTVLDTIAPIALGLNPIEVECSADLPAADVSIVSVTDNCTGTPTVVWGGDVSDGMSCPEIITRTYLLYDAYGNENSIEQTLTVHDITNPVPDSATLSPINSACPVTPVVPTGMDNCDGAITATPDASFPISAVGTTTVIWTFADACGNYVEVSQDVVISALDVTTTVNEQTITANNASATYQWIDCDDNNAALTGETGQSFTAPINGSYAVIITDGACSDTSECVAITTIGLEELDAAFVELYPNPSENGIFSVNLDGTIDELQVLDMLGREVEVTVDKQSNVINGTSLASGKYTVRITTNKNQYFIGTILIEK